VDETQLAEFIDQIIGYYSVGADGNGDELTAFNSPAARAFVVARLGKDTPT